MDTVHRRCRGRPFASRLYCRNPFLLAAAAPRSKKASSPSSELSYLSASLPTMREIRQVQRPRVFKHFLFCGSCGRRLARDCGGAPQPAVPQFPGDIAQHDDATPPCSLDYLNAQRRIDSGEGGWWIAAFLPVARPGSVPTASSSTVVTDGLREDWA